jgi:hypothetical protein
MGLIKYERMEFRMNNPALQRPAFENVNMSIAIEQSKRKMSGA